jgi:hypothetical protein
MAISMIVLAFSRRCGDGGPLAYGLPWAPRPFPYGLRMVHHEMEERMNHRIVEVGRSHRDECGLHNGGRP